MGSRRIRGRGWITTAIVTVAMHTLACDVHAYAVDAHAKFTELALAMRNTSGLRGLDVLQVLEMFPSTDEYAKLPSTLGHIMHLVQDSTSPPHVRNDPHGGPSLGGRSVYEENIHAPEVVAASTAHSFPPAAALLSNSPVEGAQFPTANLWDHGIYHDYGSCSALLPGAVGSAEFTAAHFLSEDAMPGRFPCPSEADLGRNGSYYDRHAPNGLVIPTVLRHA